MDSTQPEPVVQADAQVALSIEIATWWECGGAGVQVWPTLDDSAAPIETECGCAWPAA